MKIIVVPANELFNSDELVEIENVVQNLPPLRKLYGPHREYARFIDLPEHLAERATMPYSNVSRVEYDVDDESVRFYS